MAIGLISLAILSLIDTINNESQFEEECRDACLKIDKVLDRSSHMWNRCSCCSIRTINIVGTNFSKDEVYDCERWYKK